MAVLTANNLNKSYGPEVIFSGITLSIPQRARVAIVGPNGIGKTTLLKILSGEETATSGSVHLAKSTRLGYLPQEVGRLGGQSLWVECLGALEELRSQEKRLKAMEVQMAADPENQELLAQYGGLQQAFEHAGGYTYENAG